MKKMWLIILLAILVFHLNGKQLTVLTEVLKPDQFMVAGDRFYIMEGVNIFIYSLKDLKLIKKFGKKGEGPGEVLQVPFISNAFTIFAKDKILVDGINKIVMFSRDGVMEKEMKKKGRTANILPVGEGFVATRIKPPDKEDKNAYITVALLDGQMNVTKDLYAQPMPQQGRNVQMVPDTLHVGLYEDKIFIEESTNGFIIEVFDLKGNALYKIQKEMPPLKVTEKHKESMLQEFKNDRLVQFQVKNAGGWDEFKKLLEFHYPDTYPSIRDMLVRDGKIYIRTYITQNNSEKYFIFDLKGKELKTVFLPKPMLASLITRIVSRVVRFFDISKDTFYYLVENEEEEEWELHSVPIGMEMAKLWSNVGTK